MWKRLADLWYRIKCRLWHRYTTVTPRSLPKNSWVDRCELMPHMIFEVLSDFYENECGEDSHVDWSWCIHDLEDGTQVNVLDEIKSNYDWWHNDYLPNHNHCHDEWHAFQREHSHRLDVPTAENLFEWRTYYDSDESAIEANRLWKEAVEKKNYYELELKRRLRRIIEIHEYMWT